MQLGNKINRYDPATAIPLLEKQIEGLTKGQNKIETEIENLPTLDTILYRVDIFADNGSNLSSEVLTTTLTAQLTMWDIDITADTDASFFSWTRVSGNAEQDALWNAAYGKNKKSLVLDGGDVGTQSTFICTVNDGNNLYTQAQIIVSSIFRLEAIESEAIVSSKEQFYQSTSPTELSGGSWSDKQPTWTEGRYIWKRTLVTYGDGRTEYTPSENGICITGNTGLQGPTGPGGADGQMLYATSSTEAGTAAKVATLSAGSLTLKAGVSVSVKFTNANTAINPTLNVNGTGAKAVYTNGVRYAFWSAGQTVVFTYDGTNWQVASTPVYANIATVGNSAGRNVYIDDEAVYIRNGTTVLASFDEDEIYLGKNTPSATIHLCGNIATLSGYSVDNGALEALALTSNYIRLSAIAPSQAGAGSAPSIEVSLDKIYVSGANIFSGSSNFDGEQKFSNSSYCPTITDSASGVGCAFKASRGLFNEALIDKLIMTASMGKIPFYTYTGTSNGSMTGLSEVASISSAGLLTCKGITTTANINGTNEYLSGSLYVGGKKSTTDGKAGVAFGASGNITMQSTSTAKINFINGANTSAKAYIASGSSNDISLVAPGYIAFLLDSTNQIRFAYGNDGSTPYFYPLNDATCRLGSTDRRWYRLYQSYSSVSTSDKRQKENIKALKDIRKHRKKTDGSIEEFDVYDELFNRLEPVEYNFIKGENRKSFGLIAQDVIAVMEELGIEENELDLVHHDTWIDEETGEERDGYGIAYENLIVVLIHEVQKLKATVQKLKATVKYK